MDNTQVTVQHKNATLGELMHSPAVVGKLNEVWSSPQMANSFMSSVISVANGNPQLRKAEPMSIIGAAMVAATMQLQVIPTLGQCYIIPYGSKAQFQVGYLGLLQLCQRSGQFKKILAAPVHEGEYISGDEFDEDYVFDKKQRKSDKIVGYMAKFELLNGFTKVAYWDVDRVKAHATKFSQAYRSGYTSPWKSNFDAMAMKGLSLDTEIPTPNGFTTMEALQVGDTIYNALGKETKVVAKSEVKHLPCYKITMLNGDTIICDEEHRWFANGGRTKKKDWFVADTKVLATIKGLGYPIVIPNTKQVEMSKKDLLISPYVLGYWLGNGHSYCGSVSCDKSDAEELEQFFMVDYNTSITYDDHSNSATINISSQTGKRTDLSSLKQQLRELSVLENKHIPVEYKRASIEQRIELVRGLCDSDGSIDKQRGRVIYTSVREELALSLYEIVSSLGERASFRSGISHGYGKETVFYEVEWLPRSFNPFHLKRKADKFKGCKIVTNNVIKSIELVDSVPTQCIAVDCGDATSETDFRKSVLVGRSFIPTHNTVLKSILKYAPKSIEMQNAVTFDQAVVNVNSSDIQDLDIDAFAPEYIDNLESEKKENIAAKAAETAVANAAKKEAKA